MNQSQALDILKTGRNVYLTGVAGSGKTYVLNEYINYLKSHDITTAVTASTGIAATHLGGITIHSWSGMGIKNYLDESDIEELEQKEYLWKRYEKTKVLIIDEVSMLSTSLFDSLDMLCKSMKRSSEPFGGMQIVLSGDFFQLPPIVKGEEDISFINESHSWDGMNVRVCYLDEQFRYKGDRLEEILNEMRRGELGIDSKKELEKAKQRNEKKSEFGITRLFTHNVDVDKLNEKELGEIKEREYKFEMSSKGRKNLADNLKKGVLAPETLKLKKGAVVMFVKNNFEVGYVNGTLGIVESFKGRYPLIKTFSGEEILAEEVTWSVEDEGKALASVEQIPLRLAWAITVHKSQGMSMDAAEIDLSRSFVAGQGYVALSRLRSLSGLFLKGINEVAFSVNRKVVEFDKYLLEESKKWSLVVGRFSKEKIKEMHEEFILKCGGSIKELEKKDSKANGSNYKKLSTYASTLDLLKEGFSLKEISEKRKLKEETIISHFEKLKEEGKLKNKDIKDIKPAKKDFEKIKKAFEKTEDEKLKPIHDELGGKYSYKDIRLARLFLG